MRQAEFLQKFCVNRAPFPGSLIAKPGDRDLPENPDARGPHAHHGGDESFTSDLDSNTGPDGQPSFKVPVHEITLTGSMARYRTSASHGKAGSTAGRETSPTPQWIGARRRSDHWEGEGARSRAASQTCWAPCPGGRPQAIRQQNGRSARRPRLVALANTRPRPSPAILPARDAG